MKLYPDLKKAIQGSKDDLLLLGRAVNQRTWQSVEVNNGGTLELLNLCFKAQIPNSQQELNVLVEPTQPWAEDHFLERVGGKPLNPGNEYKNWPYFIKAEDDGQFRTESGGKFSHTYMERMWAPNHLKGIRYQYGNLEDVVSRLVSDIDTRQAYLPIWFPEDTNSEHRERVPCTLGYQFIHRNGYLHCNYFIRSCDVIRHFRNDVYFCGRLTQWVIQQIQFRNWDLGWCIKPGFLTFFCTSFHVFKNEIGVLKNY